jgi:PTS system beta-glucosides-specific IIC component
MTYPEIAERIVELVGTDANIISIMSCMTRLRIETIDKEKIDTEALKQVEKVKGVTLKGSTVQIILLGELKDVYKEVEKLVTVKEGVTTVKKSVVDSVLDFLSGTFIPILPAIIGCGLLQGIMVAVTQFGWLSPEGSTYRLLTLFGQCGTYFFPIFIAMSAAKKLKTNPYLAVLIAGIMIHPTFLGWVSEGEENFKYFFLPIRLNTYTSSVLPMLLSIWVLKYVEMFAEKISPKSLRMLLVPFITLVIGAPLCLGIAAPLGSYIGDYYTKFLAFLVENAPIVTGIFLGAVSSLLVLTGLHSVAVSFIIVNIASTGTDFIYPIMKLSTIILGGIALGAWLSVKNKEEKAYCLSAWLLAFFGGLSEPSLYGVVVKYKRPFVPMIVTGMIVGTLSVATGVCCTTIAGGGWIFSLAAFMTCLPQYIFCIALGTLGGAALTYLWGVEEPGVLAKILRLGAKK